MHHINVSKKYKSGDVFTLIPIGDLHIGNASCDIGKLEENIKEIAEDDTALVILLGDLAECIVPADKKRFDFDEIHPMFKRHVKTLPTAYLKYLVKLLTPIKDKILCSHNGNHEDSLLKYYFQDLNDQLCESLGINCSPGQAFTKINFSYGSGGHQQSIMVNSAHGHKAGRRTGSKVNFMEDMPAWIEADIIVRGHSHSLFCNKTVRLVPNPRNTKTLKKEILVAHCGSYLSTYTSGNTTYAEDSDYPPSAVGILRIYVELTDKDYSLSYKIK